MHRAIALAAVVLLLAGLAAPGIEAIAGCAQSCPDDDAGRRCADSDCCACCLYAAPATLIARVTAPPAVMPSAAIPLVALSFPPGEPHGLLHVPKTIAS